jgi:chitodextrinase
MRFTTKGRIRLYRGDRFVSQHTVAEEAYESAYRDAQAKGPGKYTVRYPDREIDLTLLRTVLETPPAGLVAQAVSSSQVSLSWTANPRAASYRVYRGGSLIASQAGVTYGDSGLTASTQYSYSVTCVGADGQEGAATSAVTATTLAAPDVTAPSVPGTPSVSALSSSSLRVSWSASTDSGGSGLAGYQLERSANGASDWTEIYDGTATTFDDSGLSAAATYYYRVNAYDGAANVSAYSSTGSGSTSAVDGAGISSITGTVSSGQALVINGSSLGTKATAAPILWDDFQSATVGSNLPGRVPPVGTAGAYERINPSGVSSIPTVSSTRSYSGDRCAFQRYTAGQNVFPKLANEVGAIDSVYIAFWAYYTRYTGTGAYGIFKWNRAGGGPDPYTANPRFSDTIRTNASGSVVTVDRSYLNGSGTPIWDQLQPGYSAANEPDANGWRFIEYWYKLSTPGVADGKFHKWADGLQCSALGDNEMTRQSGETGQIEYVITCFDGLDSPPADTGVDLFMDNYWIDRTPQRVVVGNASTWAACTRKDPQPASSWTNSQIQITANLPNYSAGATVHFYVVDENNVPISTTGFPKVVV